ncbi:MAG: OmpA family protein [Azospirillaceae bacterium]
MAKPITPTVTRRAALLGLAALALGLSAPAAEAQRARTAGSPEMGVQGIVKSLTPVPTGEADSGTGGGTGVGEAPSELSLVVQIQFAHDSAELTPRARGFLDDVAEALADPALRGGTYIIEGHTDAYGSAAYNRDLSLRRAGAAHGYLQARAGTRGVTLEVAGYGEARPLPGSDPYDPANRRVEIVREVR